MGFYPNEGALRIAETVATELALCEVRLFKAGVVVIGPGITLAELDAEECDFTGYAPIVITAWQAAGLNPAGGASIQASVQFATAAPYTVGNNVGGYYIVDLTGAVDNVIIVQEFPAPGIAMEAAGQVIPITQLLLFGTPNV